MLKHFKLTNQYLVGVLSQGSTPVSVLAPVLGSVFARISIPDFASIDTIAFHRYCIGISTGFREGRNHYRCRTLV